jgi:hypothetical protein
MWIPFKQLTKVGLDRWKKKRNIYPVTTKNAFLLLIVYSEIRVHQLDEDKKEVPVNLSSRTPYESEVIINPEKRYTIS